MKKYSTLIVLGLLTLWTNNSFGQREVMGKLFVNGQEFKSNNSELRYFDFKPLTAKLSKNGKKYLDSFANYYATKVDKDDSLKIVVDPGQSLKEMKVVNNHIGLARAWTVHDYLKNKYGIEISKAVVHETYIACVLTGTIERQGHKNKKK